LKARSNSNVSARIARKSASTSEDRLLKNLKSPGFFVNFGFFML
jgi:hypothetical protein